MTLGLDLEERDKEQADKAQRHGKPKERSVWLERIVRVVTSRRRLLGNTRENCREDAEADCDCQFDGRLENGAGYRLLRLGQGGYDVHIDNIELQIGSDDNNSQGRERKRPIRVA